MVELDGQIHPSGFHGLVRSLEISRRPFDNTHLVLPAPDVDLLKLRERTVQAPDFPCPPEWRFDARNKHYLLQTEFAGQNELFLLHAMLISILRRRAPPPLAVGLFHRIWRELGRDMARDLPVRWLISSATTFADHGENATQQTGGMALSLLFDLIKLHDSERRVSGRPNDKAFRRVRNRPKHDLAFGMAPYSLPNGDLDRIMLARIWKLCESDRTLQPLGARMLQMVMSDRRTVFARIQRYRRRKKDAPGNE